MYTEVKCKVCLREKETQDHFADYPMLDLIWSIIEKECTELVLRKGTNSDIYDKRTQENIFRTTKQEKVRCRLEMIRGVISTERAQKVADLVVGKKRTKNVIQDLVNLAQYRFIEHIWKFRCELTAEWEEKIGITKDGKRKPQAAENTIRPAASEKRKGKEKQAVHPRSEEH